MIIGMVKRVSTMGEGYMHTYLILMCNYLELAQKHIVPIEDNQAMDDSMASDEELSKHQVEGLVGEVRDRNPHLSFYITGNLKSSTNRSIIT